MTAALYDWAEQEHDRGNHRKPDIVERRASFFHGKSRQEAKQRCPRRLSHSDAAEKVRDVVGSVEKLHRFCK